MSVNGIKYDDLEYWNDDNVDFDANSKGKLFFFHQLVYLLSL